MYHTRKLLIIFSLLLAIFASHAQAQSTIVKYLSGTGKDHTVNWDFYCTSGMNSNKWTSIAVPSCWELQGFGAYNYGHDEKERGNTKKKSKEQGLYKHTFMAESSWANKQVELVFEGVMTDAEVKLNGQPVGPVHQGSFYRFQYNITKLIKPGVQNLLEVTVSKVSADSSVNHAEREGDFWVFGGIYRPVYLKIMPQSFVERVAIDARADGNFGMDVFAENIHAGDEISAQVRTLNGISFGPAFKSIVSDPSKSIGLSQNFKNPLLWNPEYPNLYNVEVSIKRNNIIQHKFIQRFGFRTIEVRKDDGIYVNNVKIMMKGVDRHSIWPESGRTLSRKIHLMDIALIKDMNMNAVRMSHYPPDAEFLDLCDSLGLFVLDELTGWHQKYATPVGEKLVKEMVIRDVNHPSILFWDNGNEGGWNTDLDDDYALYDPQKRVVLHPWNNFNNIDTKHYPDYKYVTDAAAKPTILLHTEMIHGLYDGGHGAGLDDYWNAFKQNPHHAGGFLWVLADEGIIRKDKKDSIDTDGNHAPDGIVGPYREKEGSYYTIKEIWSPVVVSKPEFSDSFNGDIQVMNDYLYTNLSTCAFTWKLVKFSGAKEAKTGSTILSSGKAAISLAPGQKGSLHLALGSAWKTADALLFTATDRKGHEIYTWSWPVRSARAIAEQNLQKGKVNNAGSIYESSSPESYSVTMNGISYSFNNTTGYLEAITKGSRVLPLKHGPVLAGSKAILKSFLHNSTGKSITVQAEYTGDESLIAKWTFNAADGSVKLDYAYTQTDPAYFYGITFNLDESKTKGIKWLGDGPYRVWKNRMKGVTENVWQKSYNNTITGEGKNLQYPEFKGYYSNLRWATLLTDPSPFTVYTDKENVFLQLFQPAKQDTPAINYVNPPFPEGGLGFLNAIPAIGNKFRAAEIMGPQSQKNQPQSGPVNGTLWFEF